VRNGAGSLSRRAFFRAFGGIAAGSAAVWPLAEARAAQSPQGPPPPKLPFVKRVAANPTAIPAPIHRSNSVHHYLTLTAREVLAEIEPGVRYWYMTFDGQVPGPMLRVRVGDTVDLTFRNPRENIMPHTVDFHAIYGPGGGMAALMSSPGQEKTLFFKAMYPGGFIYHCAVPDLDFHISNGMYGMIVVEPEDGLPRVAREFYLGQNEMYVSKAEGPQNYHVVDFDALLQENATYVLVNGQKGAITPDGYGALKANVGETVRVFFVNGGPNLTSSFHPIGNIWTRVWTNGSFRTGTDAYMQTVAVPPGDTLVAELALPVPGGIKLVDHALTRVVRKGMVAALDVAGPAQPHIFHAVAPNA
jgi:nitrite reductase (NO-forming)